MQLPAVAQHAAQLRERTRLVGHRAQHKRGHRGIEAPVRKRQRVGDRVDDPDDNRRSRGPLERPAAQIRLRFNRDDLGDLSPVERKVPPVPRPQLEHPPRDPGEELSAAGGLRRRLLCRPACVHPREQRMPHLAAHPRRTKIFQLAGLELRAFGS